MKKKIVSFIFLIVFMCISLNVSYAKELKNSKKLYCKNITTVNQVYSNLNRKNLYNSSANFIDFGKVNSLEKLKEKLYFAFSNRVTNFSIKLCGNIVGETDMKDIQKIVDLSLELDDYTKYSYSSSNIRCSTDSKSFMNIEFNIEYLTTMEQEKSVDKKIHEILNKIIKPNMSDDDKERVIHDYIVSHVAYDTGYREHSAYAALFLGKSVCQGYSLLMYKMLQHEGIKCKIVSSYKMSHAWNMVNLHGYWYHVDCTWDDPIPDIKGQVLHNYFNLSDNEILEKGHIWDRNSYPKSDISYKYNTQLKPKSQPKEQVKLEYNNDILFNIQLNQNLKIKKVELIDNNKSLASTTDIINNIARIRYKGIIDDKIYKIKVTVEDGRICYGNVPIKSSFKVEKIDSNNKSITIKGGIKGIIYINKKLQGDIEKGQLLKLTNVNSGSIIEVLPYYNLKETINYKNLVL